ncbi:hypothetical protein ACA910_011224 [Epithemia clementina (nom. ined.)]
MLFFLLAFILPDRGGGGGGGGIVVQAKCLVKNQVGEIQDLDHLHYGVNYFSNSDSLECVTPNSCRNYTVEGCYEIDCKRERACQDAIFVDNARVKCSAEDACHHLQVTNGHEIICGGQLWMTNFCTVATLESDATIHCVGPNSCVGLDIDHLVVFRVGAKGKVDCRNLNNKNEMSCQNIMVEVSSMRRACFGHLGDDHNDCAVFCHLPHDCDEGSIHFSLRVRQDEGKN